MEPNQTGGAQSVAKIPGVDWLLAKDSDTIRGAATELYAGGHGYKTVVLDSVTSLERIILMEIMGWNEPAEMLRVGNSSPVQTSDYTERSERIRKLLRPFLDLEGINKIILANEKDHNPPENRKSALAKGMLGLQEGSYYSADSGAGTARWLADSCNFIIQIFEDAEIVKKSITVLEGQPPQIIEEATGRRIRRLRLGYHPNYAAGARSGNNLPEFIDGKIDPKTGHNSADLYKNFREAIK